MLFKQVNKVFKFTVHCGNLVLQEWLKSDDILHLHIKSSDTCNHLMVPCMHICITVHVIKKYNYHILKASYHPAIPCLWK